MNNWKSSVEDAFARMARSIYRNPFLSLLIVFLLTGFCVGHIPKAVIDTSSEELLHPADPSRIIYNEFRDQFGRSEILVVAARSRNVLEPHFIERLRRFHEDLEAEIPFLREVTSLINIRNTRGKNDELIVEDLLEKPPRNPAEWQLFRERVLHSPLYKNYVLSADARFAFVLIETEAVLTATGDNIDPMAAFGETNVSTHLETGKNEQKRYFSEAENRQVVEAVLKVVQRHQRPDFDLYPSGGAIIVDAFNRSTLNDIERCIFLSLAAVIFFLALLFRRISGVVLPFIIVNCALASTIGLMAIFGVPIKITTTVVPAFILSVGVADAVHILAIFYRRREQGDTREQAIVFAMGHSGLAVLMTSLTTAVGLMSFAIADLVAIAEIGYFASAGVMLALFYTIVLLPAMIAVFPIRRQVRKKHVAGLMDRFLLATAKISIQRPITVICVSTALMIFGTLFLFQLEFSHNIILYFPKDSQIRSHLETVDRAMRGTISLEVLVDTKKENGLYDPGLLSDLDSLSRRMERIQTAGTSIGKVSSICDIVKEIHQAMHENKADWYRLPENRQTIAQELLLFENSGSHDLEKIVDNSFQKTRVTIRTPWVDAVVCRNMVEEVKNLYSRKIGDRAEITVTGMSALLGRAIAAAIYSMAKSYSVAFVVITFMMILLVGSVPLGLLTMIPNLFPIVLVMGLMGFVDSPLDLNSLMIGSIAIGLVVDDTVHFVYNFQRYVSHTGDPAHAIRETMLGTGRAMFITSLVLSTGFFVLLSASLNHLVRFGLFTGLTVLVALAGDFLLAPALLLLVYRRRSRVGQMPNE